MILFLGDMEKQYYIEEAAAEQREIIENYGKNPYHIMDVVQDANSKGYSTVVVNVENLLDTPQEAYEGLQKLKAPNIVILFIGAAPTLPIIATLARHGYHNFITSVSIGRAKDEARLALQNKGIRPTYSDDVARRMMSAEEEAAAFNPDDSYRIITVAGTVHRIGTTTQCIQMALFLKSFGKQPVVIESNLTDFIGELVEEYNLDYLNPKTNHVQFMDVDFIQAPHTKLPQFDTYIYDCGAISDEHFPKNIFSIGETRFLVFGDAPGEGSLHAIYNPENYTRWVGSFIPENRRNDYEIAFGKERKDNLYFAPYTPDLFSLYPQTFYAQALKKKKHFIQDLKKKFRKKDDSLNEKEESAKGA